MISIKRELSFSRTSDEQRKKFRKITCLEDLSNELFYEIFDYLDGCDIHQAFFNLNNRFQNLLTHSLIPLKVNLSSNSQSTLEHRCRHVIIPNQHRIFSLHLSDDSLINNFFNYCRIDSSFNRLESIILNDISIHKILVILFDLYSLPKLSSLTIILEEDSYYNLGDIYRLIFRFPYLKYNKVSVLEQEESNILVPMFINQKPSTITRLVISFSCTLNELTCLILHTPHLQYLSCEYLVETNDDEEVNRNDERLILPHLTHISIDNCNMDFDQFEIFIKKISSQLRKLRLTTFWRSTYLDADRWKQLIKKHMPYLSEFHLDHYRVLDDVESIIQFTSSFWIEKQWFFELKCDIADFIYSIHPYRETWFNYRIDDRIISYSSHESKNDTNQNQFIPPILLTFDPPLLRQGRFFINKIKSSSITMLFTHLNINCKGLPIGMLIEIIRLLPNLHCLEISSLSLFQSNGLSPNDSEMLFSVSINNKITKVKLNKMDEMEQIHFLFDLFPHMQYLEVDCKTENDLENFIKSIIMNNITYIHYLQCLCICVPNANEKMLENLKIMIDFERYFHVDKTFTDYILQRRENKIYLNWKLHDK